MGCWLGSLPAFPAFCVFLRSLRQYPFRSSGVWHRNASNAVANMPPKAWATSDSPRPSTQASASHWRTPRASTGSDHGTTRKKDAFPPPSIGSGNPTSV